MTEPIDPSASAGSPPLVGVRVLDLAGERGAYGTRLLRDLGADVVKVEPLGGDAQRRRPPFGGEGESLTFAYYNAGKRSVQLDWHSPTATAELELLAADADVVVLSVDPRVPLPGSGSGRPRPEWVGPRPIVCALSDFGRGGPSDDVRSTHLVSFARSGQMWAFGAAGGPPLAIPGRPFYDELSAHAAAVIIAALRRPDRGGITLELSVHDLLAWRDTVAFTLQAAAGIEPVTRGTSMAGAPPSGVWATSDGFVEFMVYNPPHWDGFVELVGRPDALSDPDLRVRGVRSERAAEIEPVIAALLGERRVDEVVEQAQKLRIPCAPLNTPLDVTRDPQTADRGFWTAQVLASGHSILMPGRPFRSAPDLWTGTGPEPALSAPLPVDGHAPWTSERVVTPGSGRSSADRPDLLSGIRVLTFGTAIAGNVSATLLSELGADVAKIEAPDRPDPLRAGPINPLLERVFEPSGVETNYMFAGYSRSGRSVALNMKDDRDRASFLELLASADVLIDNFATGVMNRWGLSTEVLRAANSRLTMVSVSGFGRTGPRAHYMAYGANINSFLGLTRMWAPHGTQFDYSAVAHVMVAVMAGLTHRDRTGDGISVDLAQVEAGVAVLAPLYLDALATGATGWAGPNEVPGSVLSGVYPAAGDDSWVAVELEDVDDEDRLRSFLTERAVNVDDLENGLRQWIAGQDGARAERVLSHLGLAAGAVRRTSDLYLDPQIWARGSVAELDHQDLGRMVLPRSFVRLDGAALPVRRPSARLGQHTSEVIREWVVPAAP